MLDFISLPVLMNLMNRRKDVRNLVEDVASYLRTKSWMPTYMGRDSEKPRREGFESRNP